MKYFYFGGQVVGFVLVVIFCRIKFTGCEIDGDGVEQEEECFGYPEA